MNAYKSRFFNPTIHMWGVFGRHNHWKIATLKPKITHSEKKTKQNEKMPSPSITQISKLKKTHNTATESPQQALKSSEAHTKNQSLLFYLFYKLFHVYECVVYMSVRLTKMAMVCGLSVQTVSGWRWREWQQQQQQQKKCVLIAMKTRTIVHDRLSDKQSSSV